MSSQRLSSLQNQIENTFPSDPDDYMEAIMEVFNDQQSLYPTPGKYYTFVYAAKTEGIAYDQFPLIATLELFPWGFRGLNFHWPMVRQYTWAEVIGNFYDVENDEIEYLQSLPYANIQLNT